MSELQELTNRAIRIDRASPHEHIMIITIDRVPRRNALDNESAAALTAAFQAFDADDSVKVAILTGAGGAFCAGADLKALAAGEMYFPWAGDSKGPCHDTLSKPLIAAVEGYACAGGLGLALRCDLRVASQCAVFAVLSRRWGVPMSDGTTVRLPQLIGRGRALDMLLTAREVRATEAQQMGLVDRVVDDGQALSAAIELATRIAEFPELAMRSDRASVYESLDLPLADALRRETQYSTQAREQSAQLGAQVFLAEKVDMVV